MLKGQNGVTLVALVVTIIVLLILTGVSLSMVLGQNGVLTQASTAVVEQTRADVTEKVTTALTSIETEYQGKWAKDTSLKRDEFYTVGNFKDQFTGTVKVFLLDSTAIVKDGMEVVATASLADDVELESRKLYLVMLDENGSTSFTFIAFTNKKFDTAPTINGENKSKAAGSGYVSYVDVSDEEIATYEVEKDENGEIAKGTLTLTEDGLNSTTIVLPTN